MGDPFEAALKSYFGEVLPSNLEALFHTTRNNHKCNKVDETFLTLLGSERLLGALSHLVCGDLSPVLLTDEPSASAAHSDATFNDETLKDLARTIWTECLQEEELTNRDDDARFRRAFA